MGLEFPWVSGVSEKDNQYSRLCVKSFTCGTRAAAKSYQHLKSPALSVTELRSETARRQAFIKLKNKKSLCGQVFKVKPQGLPSRCELQWALLGHTWYPGEMKWRSPARHGGLGKGSGDVPAAAASRRVCAWPNPTPPNIKRGFDLSLSQGDAAPRDLGCSDGEGKTVQPASFSHDPETGTALSKSHWETRVLQAMF